MNKDFLIHTAREASCAESVIEAIRDITMARQLWDIIPEEAAYFPLIAEKCYRVCKPLFPDGILTILLMDESGNIKRQAKNGTGA